MKCCKKGLHKYKGNYCKQCKYLARKIWAKNNPEKVLSHRKSFYYSHVSMRRNESKLWRQNNPQKALARDKKWRKANPDKVRQYSKKWTKNNLASKNASTRLRQALKLQRTPKWLTKGQKTEIRQFYTDSHDLAWLSDGGLHVDHIVPLNGKNVSGLHVPWNLQIIPSQWNLSKSNKYV